MSQFKHMLARIHFDRLVEEMWEQIDKLDALGVYNTSFELPENDILADMLYDEFAKHSQIKSVKLLETNDGQFILDVNFSPKKESKSKVRKQK